MNTLYHIHSLYVYFKSTLYVPGISHFTSLYVYLFILILRIFKENIAIIIFLGLLQKTLFFVIFFNCASPHDLLGHYTFPMVAKLFMGSVPKLFMFLFLWQRIDQSRPFNLFLYPVFEKCLNLFSALQSFSLHYVWNYVLYIHVLV